MSGVIDGQAVNATVSNAAWLAANGATTGIGPVTLAGVASPTIIDIQTTLNTLINGVGGTQSVPATAYGGIPANTINTGATHLAALISIANLFHNTTGHKHDGTQGGGGPLTAVTGFAASGQTPLTGSVTVSGGTGITLTQVGSNIKIDAAASGGAVNSLAASGQTPLTGAVTISAGTNITLNQSGQNIQINSAGAANTINVVTKTADYTAATGDDVILCNATLTITMYAASAISKILTIKNISATGTVTVVGSDIEGDTSVVIPPGGPPYPGIGIFSNSIKFYLD